MLRTGDGFKVADCDAQDDVSIEAPWLARSDAAMGVVLGPQDDHFLRDAIDAFLAATWTLTAQADRMAYKLDGPEIASARGHDIVSDGVALGAVQVAGDGRPMVLMADRQPTGGYTKIAHVCRADIAQLAQLRPGESCSFTACDVEEARAALLALRERIAGTGNRLVPLRGRAERGCVGVRQSRRRALPTRCGISADGTPGAPPRFNRKRGDDHEDHRRSRALLRARRHGCGARAKPARQARRAEG